MSGKNPGKPNQKTFPENPEFPFRFPALEPTSLTLDILDCNCENFQMKILADSSTANQIHSRSE